MEQPKQLRDLNRDNIEAYTTKYAVDIMLPYLKKEWVIWAPFSKNEHNFADYLRTKGFKVINTHIETGQDFLTYEPDFYFDIILDNPPFKNKSKFVERTMSFKKPFALLLPFNSFGDNGIPNLYMENKLEPQMLIPKQRMEFHNQDNKKGGISFKAVYICSGVLPKQIIFTDMKKVKLVTGKE